MQLSSTAKVARWFQQLSSNPASLSRPESGFVSGDSRSERYPEDQQTRPREADELCDEYLLVEGSNNLWSKLSAKKRRKLLGMRLGKVTTFWVWLVTLRKWAIFRQRLRTVSSFVISLFAKILARSLLLFFFFLFYDLFGLSFIYLSSKYVCVSIFEKNNNTRFLHLS